MTDNSHYPHNLQLRAEAAALFFFCLHMYSSFYNDWQLFALLFFIPDLFILFYLLNSKAGAQAYNISHFFAWPALLLSSGFLFDQKLMIQLGIIWASHLAFDRMLGWGLKFEDSFFNTSMGVKKFPWQ